MTALPRVFAVGDPHLPERIQAAKFDFDHGYFYKLASSVQANDPLVLLIAGDLTWHGSLNAALEELGRLQALPAPRKYFVEGNHDPWFDTMGNDLAQCQERAWELFSSPDFYYIGGRADTFPLPASENGSEGNDEQVGICGTRGFMINQGGYTQDEFDFMAVQCDNLRQALNQLERLSTEVGTVANICLMHYPPTHQFFQGEREQEHELFRAIREYKIVGTVVFGHVHVADVPVYKELYKIHMFCVPCERVDFKAVRIQLRREPSP
jgi:predicted phosphohydrolase